MVQVVAGATSVLTEIEFRNPLTGFPLPALVAADVTAAYRVRGHAGGYTQFTLSGAGTLGTYLSGGFLEIDPTFANGSYEVGLPNQFAGTAAQGDYVDFVFSGPNGAQTKIEIEIVAYNPQSATAALSSATENAIASALLDLADAVETGMTVRQSLRVNSAAAAGKLSGVGTSTLTFKGAGVTTTRMVATVDGTGRTNVVITA